MKREAEAVPITPFHVNKQVDTVLWWRRWWWWWCFLSSITPVGGYRVRRMGMGFGVSWKATVIHRSNSVEAIPFPQTGTNRLEQTLAASFLPRQNQKQLAQGCIACTAVGQYLRPSLGISKVPKAVHEMVCRERTTLYKHWSRKSLSFPLIPLFRLLPTLIFPLLVFKLQVSHGLGRGESFETIQVLS